jgi:hypothetical protein
VLRELLRKAHAAEVCGVEWRCVSRDTFLLMCRRCTISAST